MPVEVDYPVMSVDRIEEYADENTLGEPPVSFSILCTQRVVCSICCAQDLCAERSTDSARQHPSCIGLTIITYACLHFSWCVC